MEARLHHVSRSPQSVPGHDVSSRSVIRVDLYAGLVRRIAWQVQRASSGLEVDDLVQIGMVALLEAADAYEDRGASFATYAAIRARGAMVDAVRRHASVNRSLLRRQRTIAATREALSVKLSRRPTGAELGERLGLQSNVIAMLEASPVAPRLEPMDQVYADDDSTFADDAPDALSALIHQSLLSDVSAAVAALPEREALVLQLYFVEELGLDEIGTVLGVGAARVCQIKKRALERVRQALAPWS